MSSTNGDFLHVAESLSIWVASVRLPRDSAQVAAASKHLKAMGKTLSECANRADVLGTSLKIECHKVGVTDWWPPPTVQPLRGAKRLIEKLKPWPKCFGKLDATL